MKRKAIVCDIDGVLLDSSHIMQETEDLELYGDLKWDYFYNHCNDVYNVKVIENGKNFYNLIRYGVNPDVCFIFSTARNEKCSDDTLKRLAFENIFCDKIYMRKQNDLRPANEVKREHLLKIMEEFDVIAFIDDDIDNCNMAKELGILALRRV